eukprot:812332_1
MEECTLNKDCQAITEYTPTCPVILFDQRNTDDTPKQIGTMPCQQLHANVECFVSTAIVSIEGEWTNLTNDSLNSTFVLPTHGTIISFTVNTVPQSEAGGVATKPVTNTRDGDIAQTPKRAHPDEPYNAGFFRFPGIHVDSGSTISVKCQYFETLKFHRKGYFVSLPLYFPPGTIRENANVTIECKLNGLSTDTKVDCWTHHIKLTESPDDETPIRITCTSDMNHCKPLEEEKKQDNETSHAVVDYVEVTGRDFELAYKVDTNAPQMHCIRAVNSADSDSHSESICVFVTPPSTLSTTFGRAFFFLLDKSASMVSEPYREARSALHRALDRLCPSDQFNVCVFDHHHVCYQPTLVPATKEMISNCRLWIEQYQAQGITSLQPQLPDNLIENLSEHAVFVMTFFNNEESNEKKDPTQNQNAPTTMLENRTEHPDGTVLSNPLEIALEQTEQSDLLPFIVIISDGAVQDETTISKRVKEDDKMRTRIITLGIGSYCNWFFLTELARLGRGFSDIVVFQEKTCIKMDRLMRLANIPVLTDIEIGLQSDEIELYPCPIPDLFVGAPLVITARYSSDKCPSKIVIRGFNDHGGQETMTTQIQTLNDVPVDKIFAKKRSDSMAMDGGLVSSPLALPSMFTSTVMFEITHSLFEEEEKKLDDLINNEQEKCLDECINNTQICTCLYDVFCSQIFLYSLCFVLILATATVLLVYFWNSISDCDWCMLLIFSGIAMWFSGFISCLCKYVVRQLREWPLIKSGLIGVCILEPIVIIATMRLNVAASVVVCACGAVSCVSMIIGYIKDDNNRRLKNQQKKQCQRGYVGVVDKTNSLYWIYNEKSLKLLGPFNKEGICEMYISREIHGKIEIQNVKSSGNDDRDWFELYLPPLYPQDLRKLATQEYIEFNAENIEIQSRFKKYLPNLYEALKTQKLEFDNELINVPQLPTQSRYRYGAIDTIIRVFGTILMAILQIMFSLMASFTIAGFIVAATIFQFVWCIVYPIWFCVDKKSVKKHIRLWNTVWKTFNTTLRRQNLNEIVLLGALSKTEKTVILCGAALRNISILASASLLMYVVFIYGGYSEIQSWMVGFVAWSFFRSFVWLLDDYATMTANVKLMDMIGATSWLINGIHISENVDVKSAGLFRSLMCLLPASVCGFLANYILQERFMLKCKESYMDSNVCFDDGVGCCEVVSSHDLMNAYYFTGGLVSNILASFTVIRISAWMLTFVNPEFKSYSSKRK